MSQNVNIWGVVWMNLVQKVVNGRRVAGVIRSLVNARDLQLETLFVPVLMYGSETMLWKEKGRSRIRAVQMDNLRGWIESRMHGQRFCGE